MIGPLFPVLFCFVSSVLFVKMSSYDVIGGLMPDVLSGEGELGSLLYGCCSNHIFVSVLIVDLTLTSLPSLVL